MTDEPSPQEDLEEEPLLSADDLEDLDPGEGSDAQEALQAGTGDKEESKEESKEEEEEEEIPEFKDLAVPSADEIRAALDWAFEGEDAPPEYLERCTEHALLVQRANRRMNLTKIVEPKEIAAKHYLDCWRTTRLLPLLGRTVLDIGTGAGYPGIPMALAEPNARVVLMDSTKKKADFVAESIEAMKIPNAEGLWGRAEEYLLRNKVEVAVVRALSSVRENVRLLRKVRHSLQDLIMMKGPSWSREVRAGEREAERLGFRLDTVWEHELPGELGGRAVLVYRAPGSQGM